jgi:hypothetical protein
VSLPIHTHARGPCCNAFVLDQSRQNVGTENCSRIVKAPQQRTRETYAVIDPDTHRRGSPVDCPAGVNDYQRSSPTTRQGIGEGHSAAFLPHGHIPFDMGHPVVVLGLFLRRATEVNTCGRNVLRYHPTPTRRPSQG